MENAKTEVNEKPEKKKVSIEIVRKDGKSVFRFSVDKKIEQMYADRAAGTRKSESWKGLEFYAIPSLLEDRNYRDRLANYYLVDDYGQPIIGNNGRLNIAWLRTVGGQGEIEIKNPIGFAELSRMFRNAIACIKEQFEEEFASFKIKGEVSLEL
ncbi:MAG: hypothetical protein KGJ90_04650 [Patescibacteria group bacterium]|nr:hypothetical protein [Patescibacteria group bacterium]